MDKKPVTRIDLEKDGNDVKVRQWFEGWVENDPADITETIENAYIVGLLMRYENQGYAVEMCDATHGRALRGKTTRIDFTQAADGSFHVRKFPYGWTAKTKPISDEIKSESDYEQAILWCVVNGWHVRRWPGGARAFKGAPQPVRDRASILTMRRKVEADMQQGRTNHQYQSGYDFALDY